MSSSSPTISRSTPWLTATFALLAALAGTATGLAIVLSGRPLFAAAAVIGLVVVIITLLRPELGLLMLLLITYTRLSDNLIQFSGMPSIARPFIALLLVSIVVRWMVSGVPPKGWFRPALLVGLYGLIVFGSLFYAKEFPAAATAVDDFFKDGVIAVLVVMLLQRPEAFRRAIWTLVGTGIFLGLLSVYQYLTGSFDQAFFGFAQSSLQNIVGRSEGYRIAGPIGDPNFYAQILVVLVPLAFDRFFHEKSVLLRGLAVFAILVIGLTLVFTFSRGGFLALVITLILIAIYHPPKPVEMLVIIAIAVGALRFIPAPYTDRLMTIFSLTSSQSDVITEVSFRGRMSEVIVAGQMFLDHPILGVGAGNYPAYYQDYSRRLGLDPRTEARQAHNLFLEVAAELGLAGLSVFLLILWFMYRSMLAAWRQLKQAGQVEYAGMVAAFAIGVTGYLSAAMFVHGAYPRYFWLLAGLAMALPQAAKEAVARLAEDSRG